MVAFAHPPAKTPTYVKVANYPGLYRHSRSGRYYACKKLGGVRRERSFGTCNRKIAGWRMKEWLGSLKKVDAEVEKTTLGQLIQRFLAVTNGGSKSSRTTDQSIIKCLLHLNGTPCGKSQGDEALWLIGLLEHELTCDDFHEFPFGEGAEDLYSYGKYLGKHLHLGLDGFDFLVGIQRHA